MLVIHLQLLLFMQVAAISMTLGGEKTIAEKHGAEKQQDKKM